VPAHHLSMNKKHMLQHINKENKICIKIVNYVSRHFIFAELKDFTTLYVGYLYDSTFPPSTVCTLGTTISWFPLWAFLVYFHGVAFTMRD
jgi:hypothetical protein